MLANTFHVLWQLVLIGNGKLESRVARIPQCWLPVGKSICPVTSVCGGRKNQGGPRACRVSAGLCICPLP